MTKGIKGFIKGHKHSESTKKKIGDIHRRPIYFDCDYCGKQGITKPSHYKKKNRHFCSMKCYAKFRKTKLPMVEQHAYKGIRKEGQTKQVYHRNYCKRHPKRIAHLKARRYAREKHADGKHSFQEWKNLVVEFDNKCAFCRKRKNLTKDHIIPLSEGGTDYIDNIQPLCRNCNSKKWKHIYESPELIEKGVQ